MERDRLSVRITPQGNLDVLSHAEVEALLGASRGELYDIYRRCSLAVLNLGSDTDDSKAVLEKYQDFDISVIQQARGIKLGLENAPASAFVDGKLIQGIKEHLFAVLRDIVYVHNELADCLCPDTSKAPSQSITDAVFHILRNAKVLRAGTNPNTVVCWGGHAIERFEYEYTKEVGHELGLRGLDVCTGCGPGAMKGPMKGAAIGHAKQRIHRGRYIGITEPGIIAAESPNPIVNELVILPDIEKRLEAFVRLGHGFIIFPGGAGTAEEILYLLGILLHPENAELPFPVVLTGPRESEEYFHRIHHFIGETLGFEAQQRYKIIIDDPDAVAREMTKGIEEVRAYRRRYSDAYYFNWMLHIEPEFQEPFVPNHENMAKLALHRDQETHELAANLRRAFSGIVAGNVKAEGIRSIEEHGPFEIQGAEAVMRPLDELLNGFVKQRRMKLAKDYVPCYRLVA